MGDLLNVENIHKHYGAVAALKDAGSSLRASKVHALMGENGAGKSALVKIVAGSVMPDSNRKLQGLMMQMSILENSTLAVLGRLQTFASMRRGREVAKLKPVFKSLRLKARSYLAPVNSLSGGNQQKVLFAKCLLGDPDVLFLDDPTRGIDIGAKHDIYRIVAELAGQSKSILFVSSELSELLRCCDRILIMKEGRITAALEGQDVAPAFAAIYGQKVVVIGSYVALCAAFWLVLSYTVFGRHVRAIGDNERAARYSGLPIRPNKILVYALSGLMSGFAGVLYAAENHHRYPHNWSAHKHAAFEIRGWQHRDDDQSRNNRAGRGGATTGGRE